MTKLNPDALDEKALKNCPFCGGDDIECAATGVYWVKCHDPECGAEGPTRDSEAEAIAAWNRALSAQPEQARTEGWKPMPPEATDEMIAAGCRHENMGDMAGRYRAMFLAAPSPAPRSVEQAAPVEVAEVVKELRENEMLGPHLTVKDQRKTSTKAADLIEVQSATIAQQAGELADARKVLSEHHAWHNDSGEIALPDGKGGWVEIDFADAYSDSLMCERTMKVLAGHPADEAGPMPRGGVQAWWWAEAIKLRRLHKAAEERADKAVKVLRDLYNAAPRADHPQTMLGRAQEKASVFLAALPPESGEKGTPNG